MSRPGKIARLPRAVRDTLNFRLQEGDPGPELLAWLNAQPEVQAVLAAHFKGQPVNAQNLSDWRQGGYAEWYREQQLLEVTVRLHEAQPDLEEAMSAEKLSGYLNHASMVLVARELTAATAIAEGPERLRAVLALHRAVDRLRGAQRERDRDRREAAREAEEEREECEAREFRVAREERELRELRAAREARETERQEATQKAPPPAAPAAPAPRPPAPSAAQLTSTEDAQIDAVWAAAMKLAKSTPLPPLPAAKPSGPKLPAALQAA